MGNKCLRPDPLEPYLPFNDDQKEYLKSKFQSLCNQKKFLSTQAISEQLQTSLQESNKIINYIDFEGKGEVDYYEFLCAAASLHQDDEQAQEFIFDIYKTGSEMDQNSFDAFFGTVFRYLDFMDQGDTPAFKYSSQIGQAKFKQYDYNNNGSISIDQFRSMLQNDVHCRNWMEKLGFAAVRVGQRPEKPLNHQLSQGTDGDFVVDDSQGDQAGCAPSWIKTAQYMAPQGSDSKSGKHVNAPNQSLDINYVYGYRCYDTRSNLAYNPNGQVVYHTAGCGIILNKLKNTQKVSTQHNDDITCLDANPKKNLVVTGEMGRKPALVVWDATTAETKAIFKNKLQKSIATVAISRSGKYVAATSMNDNHEVAVYDIQNNSLVAYGRGPRSVVNQIKFNKQENEIVMACAKEVVFAKFSKGKITCKKGIFGKAPCKPCLSVALLDSSSVVVSMLNGLLTVWNGTSCSKLYKEHSKPVGALAQRNDCGGIISGDTDGNIILWSASMSKQQQISLSKLMGERHLLNSPRIIALYEQHSNILVGTRGGQIIQLSKGQSQATLLMQGHFDQELWGLSISPSRHEFYTGGQDKLIYKWDMQKRRAITKKKLDSPISCVEIHPKLNVLAVGMRNGTVYLLDSNTFNQVDKVRVHKNPDKDMISVVRFSPDGSKLAVGYAPPYSKVYVFDYSSLKSKPKMCKGSPSRINTIDFSKSGMEMMMNNTSYEILFYNSNSGSQITSATKFKGEQWASMTSRFSWMTQGIWPACSDGSDINALDRSKSSKYLATGDDFSKIKVFDYPVTEQKQISNMYKGHSSHITGVKWAFDDKFLVSTGGLEKSVIQWQQNDYQKVKYDVEEDEQVDLEEKDNQNNDGDQEECQFEPEGEPQKGQADGGDDGDDFMVEEDSGDQALAVKPFLGQVKSSTPAQYKTAGNNSLPSESLKIKHVWGVRNQYLLDRVRNQVRYSSDYDSVLFITAALGVQMNISTKQQSFYQGQSQDLISFAMTRDKTVCATGQMAQLNARSPKAKIVDVHIWDAKNKTHLAKLSKFHQRGIVLVEFSPSGEKVLTVGQDDKNSLAVYDWKIQNLSWSSPVCGAKVTGAAWKSETEYVTVGLKHIKFWNKGKGSMGKISGSSKWDPMLSATYWKDKYVSGGSSGLVYLWNGNSGVSSKGHQGKVDCFAVDQKGVLYSGDSKGVILSWRIEGGKLTQEKRVLSADAFDKINPGILSMEFSPSNQILICTNSSSIYQVEVKNVSKTKTIMTSHCKGELWAQSWSPDSKHFVTAGDDKVIRVYNAQTYEQEAVYTEMKEQVRGIDWQKSTGELIIVGDYRGNIHLFDTKLQLLSTMRTRFGRTKKRRESYWIEDIKFSPDGKKVAFGAHGGPSHVQIYSIDGNEIQDNPTIIKGLFSSALLSIDWSQSSDNLAAISLAYQLQFMSLDSKVSASSMRDTKWATWTGKFGYQVAQVHQDVDYSNINTTCMSPTRTLVASGGDDQKIRLFNYPVNIPKQKNKQFVGHSSHVTRVRFSQDQQYLLSTGGNDRTTILWQVEGRVVSNKNNNQNDGENQEQVNEQEDVEDYQGVEDFEDICVPRVRENKKEQTAKQEQPLDDFMVEQDQGDQFMAVKPWLGAIKQPTTSYYKGTGRAPPVNLQPEYAHGYRSKDCRNNLKYLPSGQSIAYHTAGLGIAMPTDTHNRSQIFFTAHSDDIISFYQTKHDRQLLYSGEMGAKPVVYSWEGSTGTKIGEFKGAKKGVSSVLANEEFVLAAGLDDNHYVYLWSVKSGKLLGSEKGGRDVILAMEWTGQDTFISIGVKHYKEWTISGNNLKGSTGQFGKNCNILCSIVTKESTIYVGASDGSLQTWKGRSCTASKKVHKHAIHALCIGQNVLLTGSGDKTIKVLNSSDLQELSTIDCNKLFPQSVCPSIRAVDIHENKILVGTLGSEIYEIVSNQVVENTSADAQFKLNSTLMTGHYAPNHVTNEVWGLAHYDETTYATCSDDGTVRLWDMNKKQQLACTDLFFDSKLKKTQPNPKAKFLPDSVKGRCICVSSNHQIVIGCKDGTLKIIDSKLRPMCSRQVNKKKKQISHVQFSPDERLLAVGDHEGYIAIYNWNDGKIKGKSRKIKHNSYIKHFDFSRDSNIIHSTCGAYELLFWDANTAKQITSGATMTRDEEWATWNVTFGWPVQGIFEQFMDGTDVNAVDRSLETYNQGMKLLASGDDRGKVRVLEYPCVVKNSDSVKGKGHSSHVTNVKFAKNDQIILSTGGQDQTVIQWRCTIN